MGEIAVEYGERTWAGMGKRWDIVAAALVLAAGIAAIVGVKRFILGLINWAAFAVGSLYMIHRRRLVSPSISNRTFD